MKFRNEEKNIFMKKQRILMNFHIFSAYYSEISLEFHEKIWNCPNLPLKKNLENMRKIYGNSSKSSVFS
jgi:hypothetical protein